MTRLTPPHRLPPSLEQYFTSNSEALTACAAKCGTTNNCNGFTVLMNSCTLKNVFGIDAFNVNLGGAMTAACYTSELESSTPRQYTAIPNTQCGDETVQASQCEGFGVRRACAPRRGPAPAR